MHFPLYHPDTLPARTRVPDRVITVRGHNKSELMSGGVQLCPNTLVVCRPYGAQSNWSVTRYPTVDPHEFCRTDPCLNPFASVVAEGARARALRCQEGRLPYNGRLLEQRRSTPGGQAASTGWRRGVHVRHQERKLQGTPRHGIRTERRTHVHPQHIRGVRGAGTSRPARR